MKATWDPDVDAVYLKLSRKSPLDAQEVQPGIFLHYSNDDTVVGIEILDFAKRFNREKFVNEAWADSKEILTSKPKRRGAVRKNRVTASK